MLAVLTIITAGSFSRICSLAVQEQTEFMGLRDPQQQHQNLAPLPAPMVDSNGNENDNSIGRSMDESMDDRNDNDNYNNTSIGQRMREWLLKKPSPEGNFQEYFYNPSEDDAWMKNRAKIKPYSVREIAATIPHFTGELLLVMYTAQTDEFIAILPGNTDKRAKRLPECKGGCVRIKNIMHAILYAFRNQYSDRFQKGGRDLMFLVSTGDSPRLSKECLEQPEVCKRQTDFAPILHFGSAFRNTTILPGLVLMPPPPNKHLRCMAEWQMRHEVCEFLLPKQVTSNGKETNGITYGELVDYNLGTRDDNVEGGIGWDDLIPQVVWRGSDFPYLTLLHPEMRGLQHSTDAEWLSMRGTVQALHDLYDSLRPRWKAIVITTYAELEANTKNANPEQKQEGLPWANMKFSSYTSEYEQWNALGVSITGKDMSMDELAKFKYHIDIGGGGGTSLQAGNNPGTLEKLALPGLLFHHVSGGVDWYHEHLVPWVHFVPIKEDLSNLRDQFEWAEKNKKKAQKIAKEGTDFVRRMGMPEGLDELHRRHLLKPLEELIHAFQPAEEMPTLFRGESGFIFEEIMRCSGYDANECSLLH